MSRTVESRNGEDRGVPSNNNEEYLINLFSSVALAKQSSTELHAESMVRFQKTIDDNKIAQMHNKRMRKWRDGRPFLLEKLFGSSAYIEQPIGYAELIPNHNKGTSKCKLAEYVGESFYVQPWLVKYDKDKDKYLLSGNEDVYGHSFGSADFELTATIETIKVPIKIFGVMMGYKTIKEKYYQAHSFPPLLNMRSILNKNYENDDIWYEVRYIEQVR